MKRIIISIATTVAIAVPVIAAPTASAAAPSHGCGVGGGGWVTASYHTSCPFARGIAQAWLNGECWEHSDCTGSVYSPVTDETYRVQCSSWGHYPEHVECDAVGTPAWIRFVYRDE